MQSTKTIGIVILILGVVLLIASYFLVGGHDIAGMVGSIGLGIGGAGVVSGIVLAIIKEPRKQ
ncbi:hypothetical protein N7326_02920 [Corynebacterium sp. ES2794-CONJ1]|uniref:hypothetical protein n=1 Tax=unclassified Corynebacterium TaxID=2624378 RepID=UPI0021674746|nr:MULTISPECIES: hypothetical protein [unclassified Corynebacterium]MCS4489528.1 hypothetical protein [Corynebacterium sp. ES2775-CONJ]MCS4491461.1 hypothetical protein [Corynebacterium sp. ES2715-CONJ3]MCS4531438.1 hypothetical protein [Corynebacterium sp. ES2730-CONJ]MCU9518826.1 hypothetical protein [Corynebacterium sp. ES2794-CONJ1]